MAKVDPKAKAKRQKVIAAILGVALVGVLAFQGPKIMKLVGGGSSTAATEPASPVPVPVPAPVPGGTVAAVPTAITGSAELVDSDPAIVPADGQLVTFDRFESKDPFAPQITDAPTVSSPAPTLAVDTSSKSQDPEGNGNQPAPARSSPASAPAPATASISVNGAAQEVRVGTTFPEIDPIFKLVSLKGNTIKVGIVGGGYANGSPTVTLTKGGKPVTLMNTADGTTYVLRLVGVG